MKCIYLTMSSFANKLPLNHSIFSRWDRRCRTNIGCLGDIHCKTKTVKHEVNHPDRERKKRKKFFFNKHTLHHLFIMFYYWYSGGQNAKDKTHPVSRKSVVSVGNVYESIPLEHFSIKDAIPEEDEDVYTEVPEHVYDKTFGHIPHVNVNPNLYQLLSELKTKNR